MASGSMAPSTTLSSLGIYSHFLPPPPSWRIRLFSHGYPGASLSHKLDRPVTDVLLGPLQASESRKAAPHTSKTRGDPDDDDELDDGDQDGEEISLPGRRNRRHEEVAPQPTQDDIHLRRLFDLLHLCIARQDASRAARALRLLLLSSNKWQSRELWRYAFHIAGLPTEEEKREGIVGSYEQVTASRQRQIDHLKRLFMHRRSLRPALLIELVPLLILQGRFQEAVEEIELVIRVWPYRLEPVLHYYLGVLALFLAAPAPQLGDASHGMDEDAAEDPSQSTEWRATRIPSTIDPNVPSHLRALRDARAHFEGALNAATNLREAERRKRARRDVLMQRRRRRRRHALRLRAEGRRRRRRGSRGGGNETTGEEDEEAEDEAEDRTMGPRRAFTNQGDSAVERRGASESDDDGYSRDAAGESDQLASDSGASRRGGSDEDDDGNDEEEFDQLALHTSWEQPGELAEWSATQASAHLEEIRALLDQVVEI